MHKYIPHTNEDIQSMLDIIGIDSINELFKDIPNELKLSRDLNIDSSKSEIEILKLFNKIRRKNKTVDELTCFLGAGSYDHYIPAVVEHIIGRSEFYTAYTPYQPEISQGTLQAIFEFQSMICELTGLDVSNASLYDAATAVCEAALMAVDSTRRKKILVSKGVNPDTRKVLKTYLRFKNIELCEIDLQNGQTDIDKAIRHIDKEVAGIIIQTPNFFGVIEDIEKIVNEMHSNKGLVILSQDPISLGILATPKDLGADIVVGDGQPLGNSLAFGGPSLGYIATTTKLMRKIPGRICGQTVDKEGKRAFVLTLQAREQHIRRDKATSNICSNQALNALAASTYMATLGKKGIKEVATQCAKKSYYTSKLLIGVKGFKMMFDAPFFREFTIDCGQNVDKINENLLNNNILGGYNAQNDYAEYNNSMIVCVTEKRTKTEIDNFIKRMGEV